MSKIPRSRGITKAVITPSDLRVYPEIMRSKENSPEVIEGQSDER